MKTLRNYIDEKLDNIYAKQKEVQDKIKENCKQLEELKKQLDEVEQFEVLDLQRKKELQEKIRHYEIDNQQLSSVFSKLTSDEHYFKRFYDSSRIDEYIDNPDDIFETNKDDDFVRAEYDEETVGEEEEDPGLIDEEVPFSIDDEELEEEEEEEEEIEPKNKKKKKQQKKKTPVVPDEYEKVIQENERLYQEGLQRQRELENKQREENIKYEESQRRREKELETLRQEDRSAYHSNEQIERKIEELRRVEEEHNLEQQKIQEELDANRREIEAREKERRKIESDYHTKGYTVEDLQEMVDTYYHGGSTTDKTPERVSEEYKTPEPYTETVYGGYVEPEQHTAQSPNDSEHYVEPKRHDTHKTEDTYTVKPEHPSYDSGSEHQTYTQPQHNEDVNHTYTSDHSQDHYEKVDTHNGISGNNQHGTEENSIVDRHENYRDVSKQPSTQNSRVDEQVHTSSETEYHDTDKGDRQEHTPSRTEYHDTHERGKQEQTFDTNNDAPHSERKDREKIPDRHEQNEQRTQIPHDTKNPGQNQSAATYTSPNHDANKQDQSKHWKDTVEKHREGVVHNEQSTHTSKPQDIRVEKTNTNPTSTYGTDTRKNERKMGETSQRKEHFDRPKNMNHVANGVSNNSPVMHGAVFGTDTSKANNKVPKDTSKVQDIIKSKNNVSESSGGKIPTLKAIRPESPDIKQAIAFSLNPKGKIKVTVDDKTFTAKGLDFTKKNLLGYSSNNENGKIGLGSNIKIDSTSKLTKERVGVAVSSHYISGAMKVGQFFVNTLKSQMEENEEVQQASKLVRYANAADFGYKMYERMAKSSMKVYGVDTASIKNNIKNVHRLSNGKSINHFSVIDLKDSLKNGKIGDHALTKEDRLKVQELIKQRRLLKMSESQRLGSLLNECGRFGKMSEGELRKILKSGKLSATDKKLAIKSLKLKKQIKLTDKARTNKLRGRSIRRSIILGVFSQVPEFAILSNSLQMYHISKSIFSTVGKSTMIVGKIGVNTAKIAGRGVKGVGKITGADKIAKKGVKKIKNSAPARGLKNVKGKVGVGLNKVSNSKIVKGTQRVVGVPKKAVGKVQSNINFISDKISNLKVVKAGKKIGGVLKKFYDFMKSPIDFIMGGLAFIRDQIIMAVVGFILPLVLIIIGGMLVAMIPLYFICGDSKTYTVQDMVQILDDKEADMWNTINTRANGRTMTYGYNNRLIDKYTNVYYNYYKPDGSIAYTTDNKKEIISMATVHFQQDFKKKNKVKEYLEKLYDDSHKVEFKDSDVYACTNGDLCKKTYGDYSTRTFYCFDEYTNNTVDGAPQYMKYYNSSKGFKQKASENNNHYIITRLQEYKNHGSKGGCIKDESRSKVYDYLPSDCKEYKVIKKMEVDATSAFSTPQNNRINSCNYLLIEKEQDSDKWLIYESNQLGEKKKLTDSYLKSSSITNFSNKYYGGKAVLYTYSDERKAYINEVKSEHTYYDCTYYTCDGHHVENICYGHTDLTVNITIYSFDEIFDIDSIHTEWKKGDIEWVKTIYNQDWNELYGISFANGGGSNSSLSESEINDYLNTIPTGTNEDRKKIVSVALSAVGKCPYVWGGTAQSKDFSELTKGLDCSHFVDWVYWNVMDNNLGNGNTTTLWSKSKEISYNDLKPGDIAFLNDPSKGSDNHVGIYIGKNDKGEALWVHCNGSANNVSVNTISYWKYFRRLHIMKD